MGTLYDIQNCNCGCKAAWFDVRDLWSNYSKKQSDA